jgi:hypothetical protein
MSCTGEERKRTKERKTRKDR